MLKSMTLALLLAGTALAATGCKSSDNAAKAPAATATAGGGVVAGQPGKGRDGRVNFKAMHPGMMARGGGADRGPDDVGAGDLDGDRAQHRAERMAKIDTDGDGQISDAERMAARKAREAEMLAKLDTNKDGVISPEERTAAQQRRAETLRTKLDTDGDGKLTVAEMQSSRFSALDPAALDTNHDGVIGADELAAGLPTRPRFDGGFDGGPDGAPGAPGAPGSGGPAPTK